MTDSIVSLLVHHGYIAIFLLMLVESACIPVPSEVTMLVGGALCSATFVAQSGASGDPLNLVAVTAAGVIGNLVGSLLAWAVGYKGGRTLVLRWGRYIRLNEHHLERSERWFERRGKLSVFVGRLLPVIRTFISLPAGIAKMSVFPFVIYTILGCIPWTFALALAGRLLGNQWTRAENGLKPLTYAVVVVIVVLVVAKLLRMNASKQDRASL